VAARTWRTARRELALDRAIVLGILNITPDSFSDGGRHLAAADALAAAKKMKEQGADILDVGGESTRPGAAAVSEREELDRVIPVIKALAEVGLPISIDTRRAAVARMAIAAGAEIVNDVSGLMKDPSMAHAVADAEAGVIVMHMRGDPDTMDAQADYGDVVTEVAAELAARRDAALKAGIKPQCIVLDPGLGFAKKSEHNLAILARLDAFTALGHPILVGPSRKRFLGTITGKAANERDSATAAACAIARMNGASLFRVHNVAAAREALDVADAVLATSHQPPAISHG
jgi:dihydropteroate synthase